MSKRGLLSIGDKKFRLCALRQKKVRCHGICKGAFVSPDGEQTETVLCAVFEKWFDSEVNCKKVYIDDLVSKSVLEG